MNTPIGQTKFEQFSVGQRIALNLNNFQPVFAQVLDKHQSNMNPYSSVILQLFTRKITLSDEWWNTEEGQDYREMMGSIATELPVYPLIDTKIILNFYYGNYYNANNPQLAPQIQSIRFLTSGGGKSRKYYKKLSKKYRKNRKNRKNRKTRKLRKNKNKNKYSK